MTTDPTAQPTPTPAPVQAEPWELRVLAGGLERWMLDDEADIAKVVDAMVDAGAWQLFELTMDTSDRSPTDAEVRNAAEHVRAALRSDVGPTPTPDIEAMPIRKRDELVAAALRFMTDRGYRVTMPPSDVPIGVPAHRPAPVAVPEGGWRDGDWLALIDGRVWHVSDDALLHDERGRIMDADYVFRRGYVVYVHAPREAYGEPNDTTQHAPRPEPVTAPLPSETVEALADQVRLAVPAMMPGLAERIAEALTAAGYTLPAADQRARDEGTVREALAELVEVWETMADKHHQHAERGLPAASVDRTTSRVIRGCADALRAVLEGRA